WAGRSRYPAAMHDALRPSGHPDGSIAAGAPSPEVPAGAPSPEVPAGAPSPEVPAEAAEAGRVRVFLADDHAVLRAGLRLLIDAQPALRVVGGAGDGVEAVEQASALARAGGVDVVVLDIGMPRLDGLEALRRLKAAFPELAVLVLTMHASEAYLFQVIQAGGA